MSGQSDWEYWMNADELDDKQTDELRYATRQELIEHGIIDNREEYEQ